MKLVKMIVEDETGRHLVLQGEALLSVTKVPFEGSANTDTHIDTYGDEIEVSSCRNPVNRVYVEFHSTDASKDESTMVQMSLNRAGTEELIASLQRHLSYID